MYSNLRCGLYFLCALFLLTAGAAPLKQAAAAEAVPSKPAPLQLLLPETPKPNYGVPVPSKITGQVLVQKNGPTTGLKNVSISDGYSTVKTDAQGKYKLTPNQDAVFINISRPTGYDIQGSWYKPLAEQVDFTLTPAPDENEYTFIHVTDTHTSTAPRSVAGLTQFVREVNAMTNRPRFVLNSGDLLDLSKSLKSSPETGHAGFRNYVGIMNHLKMPHYNVAGDHTDSSYRLQEFPRGDHRCGKPMYWEYLGPHFFSFEYGKIHFVSVDYGYHLGQSQREVNGVTHEYPIYEVQPMHTQWLQQDMAQRSAGTFVITSAEHDLTKHCPGFLDMAKQHDIRLQLVGDHHIVTDKKRAVPYRVGGALAGCWWNPKANQLCPDLSPQGYMIYHVNGEKLDSFYKGLGQRIAITSPRLGTALSGQVEVHAHLVQPEKNESLEYTLNGTNWLPMQENGQPFCRTNYVAKFDSTKLPDGFVNFQVRSTQTDEIRSRRFVIKNESSAPQLASTATISFKIGIKPRFTSSKAATKQTAVLFNGTSIGQLKPKVEQTYSFPIKPELLAKVNTLSFKFSEATDGMSLTNPVLTLQEKTYRDPRDTALRKVRAAHWGTAAAAWGGFLVGNTEPPDETPFIHRQNEFHFVVE